VLLVDGLEGVALISAGVPAGGQARERAAGHPFATPRGGEHDGVRCAPGRRGQSEGATTPDAAGVMTCTTRADQSRGRGGGPHAAAWVRSARTWWSRSA
jgi:hypothetical protein